jgi:hypothetical protein
MQELSQKHKTKYFAFSDEGMSPNMVDKMSDEILKRGMTVKCSTNVRLEHQFTPDLCNKAFKAGFKLLYLGLESGCNRVLNHMKKGTTKETAAEVCRNIYNAGIWNHLYVFFGFPSESRAEAQETIDFLLSNKNIIHHFNIGNFILSRGSAVNEYPEAYGISGINANQDTDFSLTSDYSVSSGLTFSEALELSNIYGERIACEFESKEVMKQLGQDDLLLYLSHYEDSDPSLKSIVRTNMAKIHPSKQLTRKSVPTIKRYVELGKLQFNIKDIGRNIANNKNMVEYPSVTFVIFNPVFGKLSSVSSLAVDILTLCNDRNNVKQIVHKLSKKYSATRPTIEEDCIAFLKLLVKEGFMQFSNHVHER